MAIKASTQITIVDITDTYSVSLTREAYTFTGDAIGAISGSSCSTRVFAYRGSEQCPEVNVSSVECPDGISATITNNNTAFPIVMFEVTGVLKESREATINVIVDEIAFSKMFSFSIAKSGNGITSTEISYQLSSSGSIPPTGEWQTDLLATTPEEPYLWTRTVITYTNNTTSTSYSVSSTLDGLSIGTRNLLTNSNTLDPTWKPNSETTTLELVIEDGHECIEITDITSGNLPTMYSDNNVLLEWGSTYTISAWIKMSADYQPEDNSYPMYYQVMALNTLKPTGEIKDSLGGSGSTSYATYFGGPIKANMWVKMEVRFETLPKAPDGYPYCYLKPFIYGEASNVTNVFVRGYKVEKGNVATEWTPAPEDTDKKFDDVRAEFTDVRSELKTTADSISSEVSEVSTKVYDLSQQVTTNASTFQQFADSINATIISTMIGSGEWDELIKEMTAIKATAQGLSIDISSVSKGLDNFISEYHTYFTATADGLRISKSGSDFATLLSDAKLSFTQGGQEVAYIQYNKLYITEAWVKSGLSIESSSGETYIRQYVDTNGLFCIQIKENAQSN